MESALGARKGSSLFGCGLGDGEVGCLGKAHRLSVAASAMEGLDGTHLGPWKGSALFRLPASAMERLDGIHLGPWKDSALFGCGPLRWG